MEWSGPELAALMEPAVATIFRFLRKSGANEAKAHHLTPSQVTALRSLMVSGTLRMSDLASRLELSNSACSTMIDQLDRLQLVEKGLDPSDRRVTLVCVTSAGREVATAIVGRIYRHLAEAMRDLRPAERYMVLGGLESLAKLIEEKGL